MNWEETLDLLEKGLVRAAIKENGKWIHYFTSTMILV